MFFKVVNILQRFGRAIGLLGDFNNMSLKLFTGRTKLTRMLIVCLDGDARISVVNIVQKWKLKVQKKEIIGRLVLEGKSLKEWWKEQEEDPGISVIFQSKVAREYLP